MLNLIGADGKKPIHVSEDNQLEALKGDSIARETGSVAQEFTRIRSITYHDGMFEFEMKPDAFDLSTKRLMTVGEVFTKLHRMRAMLRKAPLIDPKMASEMLVELERKLLEAVESDEKALQDIQQEIIRQEKIKKEQEAEDRANGIFRN